MVRGHDGRRGLPRVRRSRRDARRVLDRAAARRGLRAPRPHEHAADGERRHAAGALRPRREPVQRRLPHVRVRLRLLERVGHGDRGELRGLRTRRGDLVERPRAGLEQRAVRLHAVAGRHLGARQLAARSDDGCRRPAHPDHGRPRSRCSTSSWPKTSRPAATSGARSRGCRCRAVGSVDLPPRWARHPISLRGRRFGVPAMYLGEDPDAGTGRGIGGPTGERIEPRASVLELWRAARADLEAAGAEVVVVDFPVVSNYEARPRRSALDHGPRHRAAGVLRRRDLGAVDVVVARLPRRERTAGAVVARRGRRAEDLPAARGRPPRPLRRLRHRHRGVRHARPRERHHRPLRRTARATLIRAGIEGLEQTRTRGPRRLDVAARPRRRDLPRGGRCRPRRRRRERGVRGRSRGATGSGSRTATSRSGTSASRRSRCRWARWPTSGCRSVSRSPAARTATAICSRGRPPSRRCARGGRRRRGRPSSADPALLRTRAARRRLASA